MDLKSLTVFEAVCRRKSFSDAARELSLTQSAVSKIVRSLEQSLATTLLVRTSRRIELTDAGRRLYSMGLDLLAFAKTVKLKTTNPLHIIRVASGPSASEVMLPSILVEFSRLRPDVRVLNEIMPPEQAMEALAQKRIDIILYPKRAIGSLNQDGLLHMEEAYREPYAIALRQGHPLATTPLTASTLSRLKYVTAGYDDVLRCLPANVISNLAPGEFPHHWLPNFRDCLRVVSETDFASLVPSSVAQAFARHTKLSIHHSPDIKKFVVVAATYRRTLNASALNDYLGLVLQVSRRLTYFK